MAELAIKIYFVEDERNVLTDYISRSVGGVAIEKDEKDKQIKEQLFCKREEKNWKWLR